MKVAAKLRIKRIRLVEANRPVKMSVELEEAFSAALCPPAYCIELAKFSAFLLIFDFKSSI